MPAYARAIMPRTAQSNSLIMIVVNYRNRCQMTTWSILGYGRHHGHQLLREALKPLTDSGDRHPSKAVH